MLEFTGIVASPGFSIGRALVYRHDSVVAPHTLCTDENDKVQNIASFRNACAFVCDDITKLINSSTSKDEVDILSSHKMMVEDPEYTSAIENEIKVSSRTAPWAVEVVTETQKSLLFNIDSEVFKERISDLQNISDAILRKLLGTKEVELSVTEDDTILVADYLTPSEVVKMDSGKVKGFALVSGGKTSHVAILAHSLNIPCLSGLKEILNSVKDGDDIILDCDNSSICIAPDPVTLEKANEILNKQRQDLEALEALSHLPSITIDGKEIKLEINISGSETVDELKATEADGIGLFRTEFLLMNNNYQKEEEIYRAIAKASQNRGEVIIRTYDVGGDKLVDNISKGEENPILGLRAVRLTLAHKDLFLKQMKAILKASVYKNIRIMFPMISTLEELDECLALLERAKAELREEGVEFDEKIKVGVMIEVPSAALCSDILARKVDFFSVGTNDLIQYTLAVDRGNDSVAYLYNPLQPSVVRLLALIAKNAMEAKIDCAVCGEMASFELYTPLLVGLGFTSLSMSAQSVARIRYIIRNISYEESKELAKKALNMASSEEIETNLKEFLNGKIRNHK